MAWDGYWQYDGTEIINAPRTEAYLLGAGKQWFVPTYHKDDFAGMVAQPDYTDPVTDGAPWIDPDVPESGDFFGFYPLEVAGAENSSRSSEVVEFIADGGSPGRLRHGTRAVVFNGLIMANSEAGAEYGMKWLRRALLGAACDDFYDVTNGLGHDLTYFSSEPFVAATAPADQDVTTLATLRTLLRQFKRVTVNTGPVKMSSRKMSCGGMVWNVQFTATVGRPFEYGISRSILSGYLNTTVANPWAPDITAGTADSAPTSFTEVACGSDTWSPIYDPNCPALIAPPAPPTVVPSCIDLPATWNRYEVRLPADLIPLWDEVVPTITVNSSTEVRNVRVRLYPDPDGDFDVSANPCGYVADFVVGYIPAFGVMTIDGVQEQVSVLTVEGHRRMAESLVYDTDGEPFVWPVLSCGYGYVMTVDVDPAITAPEIALALTPRSR